MGAADRNTGTKAPSPPRGTGQYGADLDFLVKHYHPPQAPGESNHYFDLWEGQQLRVLVASSGLTNNRALFINSHGQRLTTRSGRRYAFRPHDKLVAPGQEMPFFSVADLARVMGPEAAAQVHNIIVGGCNEEGAFRTEEFRHYFRSATNITHMSAGELGCQTMYLQALMAPSANIQALYESALRGVRGVSQYLLSNKPTRKAVRFQPYIAELFLPGTQKPFKTQVAGRELLDPTLAPLPDLALLLPTMIEQ